MRRNLLLAPAQRNLYLLTTPFSTTTFTRIELCSVARLVAAKNLPLCSFLDNPLSAYPWLQLIPLSAGTPLFHIILEYRVRFLCTSMISLLHSLRAVGVCSHVRLDIMRRYGLDLFVFIGWLRGKLGAGSLVACMDSDGMEWRQYGSEYCCDLLLSTKWSWLAQIWGLRCGTDCTRDRRVLQIGDTMFFFLFGTTMVASFMMIARWIVDTTTKTTFRDNPNGNGRMK